MTSKQLLLGFIILGVIGNIYDMLFHGMMLGSTYATIAAMTSKEEMNPMWFVLLDFIGAFFFVWVFSRIKSSFASSPAGGMMYGLLAGILVTIPGMFYEALMYKGFPMWLSFAWFVGFVLKYIIYGAVLGMIVKPKQATA